MIARVQYRPRAPQTYGNVAKSTDPDIVESCSHRDAQTGYCSIRPNGFQIQKRASPTQFVGVAGSDRYDRTGGTVNTMWIILHNSIGPRPKGYVVDI